MESPFLHKAGRGCTVVDRSGRKTTRLIRRRFEVNEGILGWGSGAFAAVPHLENEVLDWRGPHAGQGPGRYAPPEVVSTERRPITRGLDPYSICTSHVERHNLSIRTFLRRFTRLALGFSKKLANLDAAVALYVAHYNFVRWHGSIKKTPAMAAGVTGHPWTLEELMTEARV